MRGGDMGDADVRTKPAMRKDMGRGGEIWGDAGSSGEVRGETHPGFLRHRRPSRARAHLCAWGLAEA